MDWFAIIARESQEWCSRNVDREKERERGINEKKPAASGNLTILGSESTKSNHFDELNYKNRMIKYPEQRIRHINGCCAVFLIFVSFVKTKSE